MAAVVTGSVAVVDGSAGNGSTSVTVPADATFAVVISNHWDNSANDAALACTLNGVSFTWQADGAQTAGAGGAQAGNILTLNSPATGSQTFAWTWAEGGARTWGGGIYIIFIKDEHGTIPIVDINCASGELGNVEVTVNTPNTDDLIIASCGVDYDSGANSPVLDGTSLINDDLVNSYRTDVTYATPSAYSTTVTMTGENYTYMGVIVIKSTAPTTRTLKSSGGHYSSMVTWESSEQSNLVSNADTHILEGYADWATGLTGDVSINGWTTSATYGITIRAAAGQDHNGGTGGFVIAPASYAGVALALNDPYIEVNRIGIRAQQDDAEALKVNQTGCVLNGVHVFNGTYDWYNGIVFNTTCTAINCIVQGISSAGGYAYLAPYLGTSNYYNCLVEDVASGAQGAFYGNEGTPIYKNCVGRNTAPNVFTGGASSSSSNNASDDGSAPGSNSLINQTTTQLAFVNSSSNFRINRWSSLHKAGADLSGTFTNDITGSTRTQWDIGPYGNIKVRTLKTSGGDYSDPKTWEAARQRNLTTTNGGEIEVLEGYTGTYDLGTTALFISGWTVSSTYKVYFVAADGEEHNGNFGSGVHISSADTYEGTINVGISYLYLDGLSIFQDASNGLCLDTADGGTGSTFINLVCKSDSTQGINLVPDNINVYNSVCINCQFETGGFNTGIVMKNCTAVNHTAGYGFDISNLVTMDSCLAYGCQFDFRSDMNAATSTNCASEDSSAKGTGAITGITSADFVNVAGNVHARIKPDSVLVGAGTNNSSTYTDDVRGRTVETWSIGAYQNVTVKTLQSSGGDYSSLNSWESGRQRNLNTYGDFEVLECYAFTQSTGSRLTIDGWSTGSTYYPIIRAATGEEHNGDPTAGYIYQCTSTVSEAVDLLDQYFRFYDIGFEHAGGGARAVVRVYQGYPTFERVIFNRSGGDGACLNLTHQQTPYKRFRNCLMISISSCLSMDRRALGHTFENCLFNAGSGYSCIKWSNGTTSDTVFTNCFFEGGSTQDSVTTMGTCTNNAFETGLTSFGTSAVTGVSLTNDFVTYGSDYRPTAGSALKGQGANLSGSFIDDITGTTRSSWDIGPFIAQAGAGLSGQLITASQGGITVDAGAAGWSIANVDLDDTITNGQTGVVVTITGTVAASGKKVWISDGTNWVEQTVTGETSTTITITVTYGGVLSAGAATLYVRNPL